ncbi:MAG: HlyD family efflux transporter periplasmic adaptor subunit, partial [Actinobacteria bacterium]|nr:HlyD family efflux transporter periplasmic adaptor subunit [Actinomycetota bacterium]
NNSSILAPFDGIILASTYNKGEIAANNSTAITIASSDFMVKSSVNETDISKVAIGNKVTLSFDAYPEQEFEAEVADISGAPTVLNNITSYAITVKLKNTDKLKLFYGLTTNLTVITAEAKNALIVPVQAVYTENGKQYVDVIDNTQTTDQQSGSTAPTGTKPGATRTSRTMSNGGTFPDRATTRNAQTSANSKSKSGSGTSTTKKVEITTGINNYTYYEVLSGLKEGDIVITSSAN